MLWCKSSTKTGYLGEKSNQSFSVSSSEWLLPPVKPPCGLGQGNNKTILPDLRSWSGAEPSGVEQPWLDKDLRCHSCSWRAGQAIRTLGLLDVQGASATSSPCWCIRGLFLLNPVSV